MSREILQGRLAEDIALEWLLNHGFILKERNWRSSHKEIDLIMESESFLHIIEVKSLKAPAQISPFEQVNRKKQLNLIWATKSYIFRKEVTKEIRFDIVSITFYKKHYELEYIPNAFFPIYGL